MQLKTERRDHLQDRSELWISTSRQSLVEALPAKTGVTGDLRHTFGTCDITQCGSDDLGVSVFKSGFKISSHLFTTVEMVGRIPESGNGFCHEFYLKVACKILGLLDILCLRGLVATCKKQDVVITILNEINSVARAELNPKLGNSMPNRAHIPGLPRDRRLTRMSMRALAARSSKALNKLASAAVSRTSRIGLVYPKRYGRATSSSFSISASWEPHAAFQFSIASCCTRLNSCTLLVTNVKPRLRAWAAIKVSRGPIGWPCCSRRARTSA